MSNPQPFITRFYWFDEEEDPLCFPIENCPDELVFWLLLLLDWFEEEPDCPEEEDWFLFEEDDDEDRFVVWLFGKNFFVVLLQFGL